jgi:hypothetical protein
VECVRHSAFRLRSRLNYCRYRWCHCSCETPPSCCLAPLTLSLLRSSRFLHNRGNPQASGPRLGMDQLANRSYSPERACPLSRTCLCRRLCWRAVMALQLRCYQLLVRSTNTRPAQSRHQVVGPARCHPLLSHIEWTSPLDRMPCCRDCKVRRNHGCK